VKNLIKERLAKEISIRGYEGEDIKKIEEVLVYDLRKRRGIHIKVAFQHQTAVTISGSRYGKLAPIDVPALVIHSTDDPIIPIEHGKKLVELISNAEGIWLQDVGHQFPFPNMDTIIEKFLLHFESG
jgi:pimeloyl-ACP methyl ester carboxylesterase